jgi:GNAT superfamily N-acetyltransferase
MAATVELVLTDQPPADMHDFVGRSISAVNIERLGANERRPLAIMIQENGALIGGLYGRTSWRRLTIELLFVPEKLRGQGMGAKLLAQADDEAKKRGCIGAWLETFSPDARRFYERNGYRVFGEIADYPPGNTRYFLTKDFG